jgi:hypothetical protein
MNAFKTHTLTLTHTTILKIRSYFYLQFADGEIKDIWSLISPLGVGGYSGGEGKGREMTQTLYAHINKRKKIKIK